MKIALAALFLLFVLGSAHATVVNPTGGDDTHNIQTVCNTGQVVELVKGTYSVSSVSCKYITGKVPANGAYFWYEGVSAFSTIKGTSANGAPAIVCPSSGCAYANFAINPAQGGSPGIGTAGTIHGMTLDGMLIADVGGGGSGSCVDLTAAQNNQEIIINNSTFIHCGAAGTSAWCINAGVTSDSWVLPGTILANCGAGGLLISYGYGWDIRPSRVEGMFTGTGIAWVNGGQGTIDVGGAFDENLWDVSLGGYSPYSGSAVSGGSVFLSIGQAMNTRTSGGSSFDIEGQVAIVGGNFFIGSTTFHVNPSLPTNTFYACGTSVYSPTYTDTYSQQVISPYLNTACQ